MQKGTKEAKGLEKEGLITAEYTTVKTEDGRVHNGSLLYTLRPIQPIEEKYFQKKIREIYVLLTYPLRLFNESRFIQFI